MVWRRIKTLGNITENEALYNIYNIKGMYYQLDNVSLNHLSWVSTFFTVTVISHIPTSLSSYSGSEELSSTFWEAYINFLEFYVDLFLLYLFDHVFISVWTQGYLFCITVFCYFLFYSNCSCFSYWKFCALLTNPLLIFYWEIVFRILTSGYWMCLLLTEYHWFEAFSVDS